MGAPIIIDNSSELWVSNSTKDLFCEIVVDTAELGGVDISEVYDIAPGIAGAYGISGLGIDTREFYKYFGGRDGFRHHLDVCIARLSELSGIDDLGRYTMAHIIAWAKYLMDGGKIHESQNFYQEWPPA
jgi:hypothetical protein